MDLLKSYERQLQNKAEELQNALATILKDDHGIKDDRLPPSFEFGLTGVVATPTRKQLSVKNTILYDLWERFLRFEIALELVRKSLKGQGDKAMRADADKKLESLRITVINICQVIKEKYLKPSGINVHEQSFDSLEHNLMKETLDYINADKENARDRVDSGNQQTFAADLRNYVIVSELNSMATIFQLGISQLLRHRS